MSKTITLNGVEHEIPKLGFKAINKLGDQGFDLLVMSVGLIAGDTTQAGKLQIAAVCHTLDCSVAEAEDHLEEHFDNGGSVTSVLEPFETALMESEYFLSLLRQGETEEKQVETPKAPATKKTSTKTKKTTSEATQS